MLIKGQTGSKCTLGEYNLYNYIKDMTIKFGGVTINNKKQVPTKGYMVGVKEFKTLQEMLGYELKENEYYGSWIDLDNTKVYWDISVNVESLDKAEELGRQLNQIAIYNVVDNACIFL